MLNVEEEFNFTMFDLVIAYRKAKVDLFYSNNASYLDLAEYEESLHKNLGRLQKNLNEELHNRWINASYAGDFRIAPKTVALSHSDDLGNHIYSSPQAQWEALFENDAKSENPRDPSAVGPEASFRFMSNCSIDMHVISALWMREVGIELDSVLSKSARGNRLRRDRHRNYNDWALGTFEKYLWPYKKWRDDGFDAIEQALLEKKNVYCLTADATEFFHRISPKFLGADSQFWRMLEEDYDFSLGTTWRHERIHEVFTTSLLNWQQVQVRSLSEQGIETKIGGLPVGLPASGLVANLALLEFDKILLTELRPLYYGRYVDDIMLVWEDLSESERTAPLRDITEVWKWLVSKSATFAIVDPGEASADLPKSLERPDDLSNNNCIHKHLVLRFIPDYHQHSKIEFSNLKNRLYSMGGTTGLNLLTTLRAAADQRSSEWRMMPELPTNKTEVGAAVSRAKNVDGDAADSLSSLEGISMSRSNFALTLRDFEAFARDIETESWKEQRLAFFEAVRDYVLTPFTIFEMDGYIERVFSLALNCNDYMEFADLAKAYIRTASSVLKHARVQVAGISSPMMDGQTSQEELRRIVLPAWSSHLHEKIANAVERTGTTLGTQVQTDLREELSQQVEQWSSDFKATQENSFYRRGSLLTIPDDPIIWVGNVPSLFDRLFHRDLAEPPFRKHLFDVEEKTGLVLLGAVSQDMSNPLDLFQDDEVRERFEDYFYLIQKSAEERSCVDLSNTNSTGHDDISQSSTSEPKNNSGRWKNLQSLWGLVFPTRPFSASELFDLSEILRVGTDEVWNTAYYLQNALLLARGYGVQTEALRKIREPLKANGGENERDRNYVSLSTAEHQLFDFLESSTVKTSESNGTNPEVTEVTRNNKIRIAVAMLETPKSHVSASLHQEPDLSAKRYRKLTRLINQTMRLQPKPDYLVLGELAVPQEWFNAVAMKLASAGINLIAGVEYIHERPNREYDCSVHNQVWASLLHTTLGHSVPSTYKQDKQHAAHGERCNLISEDNLRLKPEYLWEIPPIIRHDDHYFGILICSELTNIHHRASFSGEIDTLFVPQWNQDLNTFNALVESAALDIHAYVVQVNNRVYGDTRIRVPAGEEHWKRDVVQLKGGLNDYVVISELDLKELRAFQSKFSSSKSTYKPLPDGYRINSKRFRL